MIPCLWAVPIYLSIFLLLQPCAADNTLTEILKYFSKWWRLWVKFCCYLPSFLDCSHVFKSWRLWIKFCCCLPSFLRCSHVFRMLMLIFFIKVQWWIFIHFHIRGSVQGKSVGGRYTQNFSLPNASDKPVHDFVSWVFPLAQPQLNNSSVNTTFWNVTVSRICQRATKCDFSITFCISDSIMPF